jgi:hypothetical protein
LDSHRTLPHTEPVHPPIGLRRPLKESSQILKIAFFHLLKEPFDSIFILFPAVERLKTTRTIDWEQV